MPPLATFSRQSFSAAARTDETMQKNEATMEYDGGDFDLQQVLPIQFDPQTKRMTVRPRIESPAAEKAALRFLEEAIDLRQPTELLFDLVDQPAISSSVLGAFVKYHRRGIEVHLLDPSDYVLEVLTHTKLHQFFHLRHRSSG